MGEKNFPFAAPMELELSAAAWIFLAAAVFFAAIVRGFAGFGFSALTVASLVFVLPPAVVVPLVLMLEVAASIQMLPGAWRHADFQWLLPTAAGVAVGTPVGALALSLWEPESVRLALYALLAGLAAANILLERGVFRAPAVSPFAAGVAAGIANGIAAVAGIVAGLFLLASRRPAATVRASLVALFFVGDIYALLWGGGLGLLRPSHAILFAAAIVPLVAGVAVGSALFSSEKNYRPLASALILTAAAVGLLKIALG